MPAKAVNLLVQRHFDFRFILLAALIQQKLIEGLVPVSSCEFRKDLLNSLY